MAFASSPGTTTEAANPFVKAFRRELSFPAADFGPVLLSALRRLAAI